MFAFVIRRLLASIPVLIGSSFLTFCLVKMSGDPLQNLRLHQPPVPRHTIELEEQRLYLDHGFFAQYWHWISRILFHWDFGPSVQQNLVVRTALWDGFLVTSRLVFFAVLIALILAVVTGVVSAVKQYSVLDHTTTFVGFVFLSMPTFWFGALLKQGGIAWNQNLGISWPPFPTYGEESTVPLHGITPGSLYDIFLHMIMPVVTLGLVGYASWSRFTRASMLEVLNSDYVRLARSKGLSNRRVLVRHALRTALIPLTTVTALDIAALLGGAIVTETVFGWHGLGSLLLMAINQVDANVLLGWLMLSALVVILFNLLADVLYGVLDPRIRHA